jgi:divalent metal cation (Fe/Co/Zn/Cd) transporter
MHFVSFIIAFVLILVAAKIFGRGLVRIYKKEQARGLISGGVWVGLAGIVIAAILFGFFNL